MFLVGFVAGVLAAAVAVVAVAVRLFGRAARQRHESYARKQAAVHANSLRTFSALCDDLDIDDRPPFEYCEGWIRLVNTTAATQQSDAAPLVGTLARQLLDDNDNDAMFDDASRPANVVYAILDKHQLFIYNRPDQQVQLDVLDLRSFDVRLHPDDLMDFELFSKSFPIELKSADGALSYHIYALTSCQKEDWFIGFNYASETMRNRTEWIESPSYKSLLTSVICMLEPDSHLPADSGQWFTALMGRLFLNPSIREGTFHRFDTIIKQKLLLVWQEAVKLGSAEMHGTPMFKNLKLSDFTSDRELEFDFELCYEASIVMQVDVLMKLDYFISSVSIPVGLKVIIRNFHAKAHAVFKPPPSNRVWIGFLPDQYHYDMDLIPVVSSASINLTIISDMLRQQVDEMLWESFVCPNMDSFGFGSEVADFSNAHTSKTPQSPVKPLSRTPSQQPHERDLEDTASNTSRGPVLRRQRSLLRRRVTEDKIEVVDMEEDDVQAGLRELLMS